MQVFVSLRDELFKEIIRVIRNCDTGFKKMIYGSSHIYAQ